MQLLIKLNLENFKKRAVKTALNLLEIEFGLN